MAKWLMKSEPDVFGWPDLVKKGREEWHSVRSYAARNNMKAMKLGDEAFFYHSNIGKEIVGIMKVVALAHPDSTAEPNDKGKIIWECVDVAPVKPFKTPVTLETIKVTPGLEDMSLIKYSRLSVQPVTDKEWSIICKMGASELAPGGSSPAKRGRGTGEAGGGGGHGSGARHHLVVSSPREVLRGKT